MSSQVLSTEEALTKIPHRAYSRAQLTLVTGKRGTGKTWFLREYVESTEPRVLVLDYHEDFDRSVHGGPGIRRRVQTAEALSDLESTDGPCRRRVVPTIGASGNCRDFAIDFFAECVERLRNCLLVIDELSLYCPTENLRNSHMKSLETLLLQGRRYGIKMVVACQRLNRIPGEFHSEATEIVVYQTSRPRDLKVLEDWGFEDAREVAPKLKVGQCVILEG